MPSYKPITDDALVQAVAAAQKTVDDERERFKRAEERLRSAEHELALLTELGRLRGLPDMECSKAVQLDYEEPVHTPHSVAFSPTAARGGRAEREALIQTVINILREHGKPMPIRPLMAEVITRGGLIPGRGEQANLISVITRVPEITRPERGVYGLLEWSPNGSAEPVQNRGRSRTTRRPSRRRKAAR